MVLFSWAAKPTKHELFVIEKTAQYVSTLLSRQIETIQSEQDTIIARDVKLRSAIDDFVVGYSMGLATNILGSQNIELKKNNLQILKGALKTALDALFPGIAVDNLYRRMSQRTECGLLLGMYELSRNADPRVLVLAIESTSPFSLAPGSSMFLHAYNNFPNFPALQCQSTIMQGMNEIQAIYRAACEHEVA